MTGELLTTQDRDTIIEWAEERQAYAARVNGVHEDAIDEEDVDVHVGELRIGFPMYASVESLEPMMWDEWFEIFDEKGLTFAYELTLPDGNQSHNYEIRE